MNIFVVEDERWALAELVQLLSSYEPAHRIIAFDNGDDALAAAESTRPDLVLTDINMPGIDGLELIEQLTRLDSTIKCMILSVHDEFEYARQSMRYGVGDYLLKPVKKEALYQAVDKAIAVIEEENRRREAWFHGTIARMLLAEETGGAESAIEREVNRQRYVLLLLTLDKGGQQVSSREDKDYGGGFDADRYKRELADVVPPAVKIHGVELDKRHTVLLIPVSSSAEEDRIQHAVSRIANGMKGLCTEHPLCVYTGLALKKENQPLRGVYLQLKKCVEEQAVFGISTYVTLGKKREDADLSSIWDKVRIMEVHYKKGELQKGQRTLELINADLCQKQVTKRQLRLFVQDMLFSLKYRLLSTGSGVVSLNDLQENLKHLNECAGYDELTVWLKEKLLDLYFGRDSCDRNPKELVPLLLQYIHAHYQENISLQQFAVDHHISMGYMSRMFKSQTGTTFSDYIAAYRIQKAKELLSGGIDRLQVVSQLVGYEDTKHFSTLFKKFVGQTPIMYAKEHSSDQ